MDIRLISEASEQIMHAFLDDRKVQEGLVLELIGSVTEYIKSDVSDKLPLSFFRLSEYVNNVVQSSEMSSKSTDIILNFGRIMSISSVVEIIEHSRISEQHLKDDAKRYESKYDLFRVICENEGISHKELAAAIKTSPSSLSQTIGQMANGRYFVYRQLGRGKYYYITDAGKALIKEINENKNKRAVVSITEDIAKSQVSMLQVSMFNVLANLSNDFKTRQSFKKSLDNATIRGENKKYKYLNAEDEPHKRDDTYSLYASESLMVCPS